MIGKCLVVVLVVLFSASVGAAISCGGEKTDVGGKSDVVGTYILQDEPGNYIEIKSDGTFYLKEETRIGVVGEWKVEDNQITFSHQGQAIRGKIDDGKIIDEYGNVFVKK